MTSKVKASVVLVAVFLLGAIAGGAVGRTSAMREFDHMMGGPPSEARSRFRFEGMRRHLALREDQAAKIKAIMDEADTERDKLVEPCGQGLDDLRKRTHTRVRALLDEEQKKQLDALEARRERHRHHGGPPMGPP